MMKDVHNIAAIHTYKSWTVCMGGMCILRACGYSSGWKFSLTRRPSWGDAPQTVQVHLYLPKPPAVGSYWWNIWCDVPLEGYTVFVISNARTYQPN